MRLIIQPDYQSISKWSAAYIANRINESKATPQKATPSGYQRYNHAFGFLCTTKITSLPAVQQIAGI